MDISENELRDTIMNTIEEYIGDKNIKEKFKIVDKINSSIFILLNKIREEMINTQKEVVNITLKKSNDEEKKKIREDLNDIPIPSDNEDDEEERDTENETSNKSDYENEEEQEQPIDKETQNFINNLMSSDNEGENPNEPKIVNIVEQEETPDLSNVSDLLNKIKQNTEQPEIRNIIEQKEDIPNKSEEQKEDIPNKDKKRNKSEDKEEEIYGVEYRKKVEIHEVQPSDKIKKDDYISRRPIHERIMYGLTQTDKGLHIDTSEIRQYIEIQSKASISTIEAYAKQWKEDIEPLDTSKAKEDFKRLKNITDKLMKKYNCENKEAKHIYKVCETSYQLLNTRCELIKYLSIGVLATLQKRTKEELYKLLISYHQEQQQKDRLMISQIVSIPYEYEEKLRGEEQEGIPDEVFFEYPNERLIKIEPKKKIIKILKKINKK